MEDDIGVASSSWDTPVVVLLLISSQAACLSDLAIYVSVLGLLAIKEAHDIETRLNEVEKLLETVISMPCKVSEASRWGRKAGVSHHQPDLKTGPCISLSVSFPLDVPADNQGKEGVCELYRVLSNPEV